jgi:hypothetical protein
MVDLSITKNKIEHHYMTYIITIILLVVVFFIYFINKLNIVKSVKDTINIRIFNGLSLLFIAIFIYYSITLDLKNGMFTTFIIWCLFVIATPIADAALLVSVPAKNLFNINLDITQWISSFIALVFVFYSYYNYKPFLKSSTGGRFLIKVIDTKLFIIFATCIIASISMAYLLNEMIDYVIYKKVINTAMNTFYAVMFVLAFSMYFVAINRLYK